MSWRDHYAVQGLLQWIEGERGTRKLSAAGPTLRLQGPLLFQWLARRSGTLSRTISGIQMYIDNFKRLLKTFLFSTYQCN